MKMISKLTIASMLFVAIIFSSVMPVTAEEYEMTAYSKGPTLVSKTINEFNGDYFLYGLAACDDGGWVGNPCTWKAELSGPYAGAATNTYASFGKNGSSTDIMPKTPLSIDGAPQSYKKTAGAPHHYSSVTTKLYY